jgi:hypothetical protein
MNADHKKIIANYITLCLVLILLIFIDIIKYNLGEISFMLP